MSIQNCKYYGSCGQVAAPAAQAHLMRVLMRLVWMSYNLDTAALICFLLARTSVMNTCGEWPGRTHAGWRARAHAAVVRQW